MSQVEIEVIDGGFCLTKDGKTLVTLKGSEGSLQAEFPIGSRDAAQECFDKCFAASDGTTGAAHKCAKSCGLT